MIDELVGPTLSGLQAVLAVDRTEVLTFHLEALRRRLGAINCSGRTYGDKTKRDRVERALQLLETGPEHLYGGTLERVKQALSDVQDSLPYLEGISVAPLVTDFIAATDGRERVLPRGVDGGEQVVREVVPAIRTPSENKLTEFSAPSVLILTAARVEFEAAIDLAGVRKSLRHRRKAVGSHIFIDLGFAHIPVWLFQCKKGSSGPGAAATRTMRALMSISPKPFAVILAGIAFGMRPHEQSMGDVLVAEQIRLYEIERVGKERRLSRGDRPASSELLFDWFRSSELDWGLGQSRDRLPRVHTGLLMSGEKLVDDSDFVAKLRAIEPESIGGEMEAAGVYAASYSESAHWIVVKGVCDWGMGKGDKYQKVAARNALDFVYHTLNQPVMVEVLQEHLATERVQQRRRPDRI